MAQLAVPMEILPSAARGTGTVNSADQENYNGRGAVFTLDITAASGTTPTLDVKIQHKDIISGKYVDVPGGSFAQKTGVGTDTLVIFPGVSTTANRQVSAALGRRFRAVATVAGTTPSFTFSLAGDLLG